jgi:hypothetical protein
MTTCLLQHVQQSTAQCGTPLSTGWGHVLCQHLVCLRRPRSCCDLLRVLCCAVQEVQQRLEGKVAKLKASRDELFDRVLNAEAAAKEEVGASSTVSCIRVMLVPSTVLPAASQPFGSLLECYLVGYQALAVGLQGASCSSHRRSIPTGSLLAG